MMNLPGKATENIYESMRSKDRKVKVNTLQIWVWWNGLHFSYNNMVDLKLGKLVEALNGR